MKAKNPTSEITGPFDAGVCMTADEYDELVKAKSEANLRARICQRPGWKVIEQRFDLDKIPFEHPFVIMVACRHSLHAAYDGVAVQHFTGATLQEAYDRAVQEHGE